MKRGHSDTITTFPTQKSTLTHAETASFLLGKQMQRQAQDVQAGIDLTTLKIAVVVITTILSFLIKP